MDLVFVHGFNVHDGGADTLDTLKPYLKDDHTILEADYGWIGLAGVKIFGKKIARVIAGMTPNGAIGVGHSNGCMELIRACEYGAPFSQLILINPALDNDINMPLQVGRIDVLHNLEDDVVTMAKWYPFSYWGDMGRVGYTGNDTRVHNHETQQIFNVEGHSGVFQRPEAVAAYISTKIII
ncbi:MAG: hypothetical protein DRQ39_05350 [Gammaproteobacteria bacterium]|nr:MAG: hypothetical protein DRQ39_05350 [Gammaproteobacteria bacterium]